MTERPFSPDQPQAAASDQQLQLPHISVCICTFKRPHMLRRLLQELNQQNTDGRFTYSAVIADNDAAASARATVEAMQSECNFPIDYHVESQPGISHARNCVIHHANGDYLALIDDDEFPGPILLLELLECCERYKVDGVLAPVLRHFDEEPPVWFRKSNIYDRAVTPTGTPLEWRDARTGNVLLTRRVVDGDPSPFSTEFKAAEDQEFFQRKSEAGFVFVWSAEAAVYEVIPPARWQRNYILRKALLHGLTSAKLPNFGSWQLIKALIAVPLYSLALPFVLLTGQHHTMALLVKIANHLGKLLYKAGINPFRGAYISD